jgi:hypothetical protein
VAIIEHNIRTDVHLAVHNLEESDASGFGLAIMDFVSWFSNNEIGKRYGGGTWSSG